MSERDDYIMEHDQETIRLEVKTDPKAVEEQARWAGLQRGMRVADVGCGPGKTSRALFDIVQESGQVVGIDIVKQRVAYAEKNYQVPGMQFVHRDAREPLDDLGQFDFIWVRFLLEYHGSKAYQIVQNLYQILKPGGILCLIDLDYNCMTHFGVSEPVMQALQGATESHRKNSDYDPYIGRKLYAFLYDIGCQDIDVMMKAHHLIFGELNDVDRFNWTRKAEIGVKYSGWDFHQVFEGGFEDFLEAFKHSYADPRRFTYTPLIACRGTKPL